MSTTTTNSSSALLLECKKLCFLRCVSAVALSICMQFLLLAVFLLSVNFHPLFPLQWISATLGLMCSFYTWFASIPLLGAVVLYGLLLGKSHLGVKRFYSSRFQWLLGTALSKLAFLGAHLLMGFLTAWLYARYLHVDYRHLTFRCYGETLCLNNRYTFLICVGVAAGCYHFVKEHLHQEPQVAFPIIPEKKLTQIRSLVYATLYKSLLNAFVPALSFSLVYWLLGGVINSRCARLFAVDTDEALDSFFAIAGNVRSLFYAWILTAQILSNMHLVQHFFSIFLAEELHFVVEKNPVLEAGGDAQLTLTDALAMSQVPILQSLSALDLYAISMSKTTTQRQAIFALSMPGGHPYNWNKLSAQCLSLIGAFTEELAASVKNISTIKSTPLFAHVPPSATDAAEKILLRQYNATIGIRRMMAEAAEPTTCTTDAAAANAGRKATTTTTTACARINEQLEQMSRQFESAFRTAFRTIPGLFYMFGEPDGAKTAFLLSNSEAIAWLTQGLAGICAASLLEDKYGVVQVGLPQVIKSMLRLKMELDKLNNVNLNGKRLDRNLVTLKSAVKRSLYKICTVFGDYLRDLVEEPEDLRSLQTFLYFQDT